MLFDHLVEERQERHFGTWVRSLLRSETPQLAITLATQHRSGRATAAYEWYHGNFNACYKVEFEDGFHAIVRFAALGKAIFRSEKVLNESFVMEYLAERTSIPVPRVLGKGISWAGPYIVMSFIEGPLLETLLQDPRKEKPTLNPLLSRMTLKKAYREMAQLVLELSKPEFPRIGALGRRLGVWEVTERPYTMNMNKLAGSANCPREDFPNQPFGSANGYFDALAVQHLCHLRAQRNDAVTTEADCLKKYVARCLFRKIARNISVEHRRGPFRLYCDDFRPSNIIVNEATLTVSAVIDWEFAYVAPAEFTYVAPWWLLLESPDDWESDLTEFLHRYTPRLRLFLEAMEECEVEKMRNGTLLESQCLSRRMRESMENGLFWFCLAARYGSMFDEIYWKFIDTRYHGPFISIEHRLGILNPADKVDLDEFVQMKMQQSAEGIMEPCYTVEDLIYL